MDLQTLCELVHCEITLLAFLQEKCLVISEKKCEKCNGECNLYRRKDKFIYRCCKVKCNITYCASPKNYFFHNISLDYEQAFQIILLFVNEVNITQTSSLTSLSKTTICDWYNFCKEICVADVGECKENIGGEGKVVEIDESIFGKRKYNRGRFVESKWVLGGVERKSYKSFFVEISNRSSEILTQHITNNVLEGSTIITDSWKGYKDLGKYKYKHLKVNHSKNFKDPETGAHTNTIEGCWNKVSNKLQFIDEIPNLT